MSELQTSPSMLDGFAIGAPMSDRLGIRCCPAIREDSDSRYIVKYISVPPSQSQLEALLITGAFRDPAAAAEYFRQQADDLADEAAFLQKLAQLKGFLSFDRWEIVPMDGSRIGYEVCLLSEYRLSLQKYMHRHSISHLDAVNLGIDICAALLSCRRAGQLYIDLKPSNIFVCENKDYRIGDLGFTPLSSLKYHSLPEKYQSAYSAPELLDEMNDLNATADTYALGMILYQIFNNGQLPADRAHLEAPARGDKFIHRIILKACDPDPAVRWKDPAQMGQALIAYMQRCTINNTLIMEPIAEEAPAPQTEAPAEEAHAPQAETASQDAAPQPEESSIAQLMEETPQAFTAISQPEEEPEPEPEGTLVVDGLPDINEFIQDIQQESAVQDDRTELTNEDAPTAVSAEVPQQSAPLAEEPLPVSDSAEAPSSPVRFEDGTSDAEQSYFNLDIFMEDSSLPETEPIILGGDMDISDFLEEETEAEAVIAAPFREAVQETAQASAPVNKSFWGKSQAAPWQAPAPTHKPSKAPAPTAVKSAPKPAAPKPKKAAPPAPPVKKKHTGVRILVTILVLALLLAGAMGGMVFYQNYYLQTVNSISMEGDQTSLVVTVHSQIEDSLLTVACSDPYGNTIRQPVRGGKAEFTGLNSGALYKINVEISGMHKLLGPTSDIFTTEAATSIVNFSAIAGAESGSALLNFTVEGRDPSAWIVRYSAEGVEEKQQTFTSHTVTVTGLEIGREYTFYLEGKDAPPLQGQSSTTFYASDLLLAQNLNILSVEGGVMEVEWITPEGVQIEKWRAHCFADGYDEVRNVTEPKATFVDIDTTKAYTIEITAEGMTQSVRTSITANPITLTDFHVDDTSEGRLIVSWDFQGEVPQEGWLLSYTIGQSATPTIIKTDVPFVAISPRFPGSEYHFHIQAADDTTVFNRVHSFVCPDAPLFSAHNLTSFSLGAKLLPTPEEAKWDYYSIAESTYTTTFAPGEKISLVLQAWSNFFLDDVPVTISFLVRDETKTVLPDYAISTEANWAHLWAAKDYHYAEINAVEAPKQPGKYTLEMYFDGGLATTSEFTVSE